MTTSSAHPSYEYNTSLGQLEASLSLPPTADQLMSMSDAELLTNGFTRTVEGIVSLKEAGRRLQEQEINLQTRLQEEQKTEAEYQLLQSIGATLADVSQARNVLEAVFGVDEVAKLLADGRTIVNVVVYDNSDLSTPHFDVQYKLSNDDVFEVRYDSHIGMVNEPKGELNPAEIVGHYTNKWSTSYTIHLTRKEYELLQDISVADADSGAYIEGLVEGRSLIDYGYMIHDELGATILTPAMARAKVDGLK